MYKQLDLEIRLEIQKKLKEGKTFTEIANETGVHKSTVGREIKERRRFIHYKNVSSLHPKNACIHRYKCVIREKCKSPTCPYHNHKNCTQCDKCNNYCKEFEEEICTKYDFAPYVCNPCKKKSRCNLSKWEYDAKNAHKEYENMLSESRKGISLSAEELENINRIVSPLLKKGQSVRSICERKKDELMISDVTIYKLLNEGLLEADLFDLKRTLQRKPRRKAGPSLLIDSKCRKGRTYEDYKKYMSKQPDMSTVEMDTVEGKKGGKVMLTLLFKNCNLQLAFLRDHNDAASVSKVFKDLRNVLEDDFNKLFQVCLGDRGSEFSDPIKIEIDIETGEVQGKVFYCDPENPGQKGGCEKNHQFIRYIIPKGTSLDGFTQDDVDFMMNNINSYGREMYNGQSPYELFERIYGIEIIKKLGIILIPADEIVLTPKLLKK